MLSLSDFLLGGVLPGVVALIVRAVLLRLTKIDRLAWPMAVAIGFAAGQAGLLASEGSAAALLSPREASHWLPLFGFLAVGVAAVAGCCRSGTIAALVGGGLLAIALPTRLLWGSVYLLSEWPTGEAIARVGALAAGLMLVSWLLTRYAKPPKSDSVESQLAEANNVEPQPADNHKRKGAACVVQADHGSTLSGTLVAPLLALTILGLAVVLATSGSLSYARLAGVLFASLAGATLGGVGQIKFSQISVGVPAAGPVVTTLAGGLLLLGLLYAEVSTPNAALLAVAFAAAGAKRGWAPRCRWRSSVLRVMACLVPLTLATVTAATDFAAATSQTENNPYENWSPPAVERAE